MTEYKFGDEFSSVYKKAKVGSKELILSKGMIVLPMFNPNNKKELKEISLNEEQLLRSGYSSFVFEGYLMNSGLDFTFFKYIMCLAQKSNSRIIYIDFLDMVRDLGVESNHYSYYREAFAEHIHKGYHSKYTYTDLAGRTTNDGFYTRTKKEADGNLFLIEISSTVASSISSEYNHKLSYEESNDEKLKSGVASMLLEKIKVLAFSSEFNLRIDLFLNLLNLQGSRESKIKVLNRAIDNLIEVGFIVSCEDIKRGRRIDSKKLKINRKYNLNKKSENFSVIKEESPEFKELAEKLHKLENESLIDDNLDDVLPSIKKEVAPAVISFSAGLDIMGCDFEEEKEPITDISGFDLEVDYDSWIDQSEIKRESTRVFEDEGFTDYNPMP